MKAPLFLETPEEALAIWASYHRDGVDVSRGLGPRSLARISPLKGLEIPHAVSLFVEETPGYRTVESLLRSSYGLAAPLRQYRGPAGSLTVFENRLSLGLPREFRPPHEEFCEAEFEEMSRELETAAHADIEKKYRSRYPGLVRGGFAQGWKDSQ